MKAADFLRGFFRFGGHGAAIREWLDEVLRRLEDFSPSTGGDVSRLARDAGLFTVKIMLIDVYFLTVIEPF